VSAAPDPPAPPGRGGYFASTGYEQDARDYVQLRLGLASLVIWLVVAFGVVAVLGGMGAVMRASFLLPLGALALLPAAAPWLAYERLVRDRVRVLEERARAQRDASGG
jgi:hypothetical protein